MASMKGQRVSITSPTSGVTKEIAPRYVLDPQEVYGSDFPGETFQVLEGEGVEGVRGRCAVRRGDSCWRSGMGYLQWMLRETDKRMETDDGFCCDIQ